MDGWYLIIKSFYEVLEGGYPVNCVDYEMEMHFEELESALSFIKLHSNHCIEYCQYEIKKA
jgi:hypothetical protein